MNDQPTNLWVPQIIKVGISAWPIVFAAVVAQVFKAYATWKVERGIKLMQLEQLIGSSSFASAVKQPMLLRQLDVLSLLLLLTWCLSPFGSQALQRSLYTQPTTLEDNPTVWYANQTGKNKVFRTDWQNVTSNAEHAADNQLTALYFLSTLTAATQSKLTELNESNIATSDQYSHPLLFKPYQNSISNADFWTPISGMGLPLVLPESMIPDDTTLDQVASTMTENFTFSAVSSYFEFKCGAWSNIDSKTLVSTYPNMSFSSSRTLGLQFMNNNTEDDTAGISNVRLASANLDTSGPADIIISSNTTWEYSFINCNFTQLFINTSINCVRSPPGADSLNWQVVTNCYANSTHPTPQSIESWVTTLEEFADDWTLMGSPRNSDREGVSNTPSKQNPYHTLTEA
jgi:hypothetical protein